MKLFAALLVLLICVPAIVSGQEAKVEATTAINLPVDSVTIYPDGIVLVKRMGSLDVTNGTHKFVVDMPDSADKSTALLTVANATVERVVYDGDPIYTLNVSSAGSQEFALSYLMYSAGYWEPRYDLHLFNDSVLVNANALVRNSGGEDLKGVRLKLVAGLPSVVEPYLAKRALDLMQADYAAAPAEAFEAAPAPTAPATGELEAFYVFELEDRTDLERDLEIGLPLFDESVPLVRMFTWDAYNKEEGPAVEEIRANNTMQNPWPSGRAMLYRNGEYVSTITMPYTPAGTNASIVVGPSPDLKVSKKLSDYNITESIRAIPSNNETHTVKETTERWTYNLTIESNLDRNATLEVSDSRPKGSRIISISPEPIETTATAMKWEIPLQPREKTAIDYVYQMVTTEALNDQK
ncbi:MAG: DUF4139 domain-containing protein [Methanotrichaceae archaeon]|nr:DUF4139 domain-containing protein [Methanotrichaceae archaeon]